MAPFKYEPFQNPYVGSIIDLMGKGDEAKAQALLRVGEIEAQAARQRGQVWGGAIQGAGNIAAKGIQDWQQEKIDKPLREQAAQLSGFQLDDAKRAARQQQSLNEGRQFLGGIRAGVDPRDPDYLPGPNGEAQKYPGPSTPDISEKMWTVGPNGEPIMDTSKVYAALVDAGFANVADNLMPLVDGQNQRASKGAQDRSDQWAAAAGDVLAVFRATRNDGTYTPWGMSVSIGTASLLKGGQVTPEELAKFTASGEGLSREQQEALLTNLMKRGSGEITSSPAGSVFTTQHGQVIGGVPKERTFTQQVADATTARALYRANPPAVPKSEADYLPGPNGEVQKYPGPSDHRPRLRPNGEEYRGLTEEQEAVLAANEALSPPPGALNALIDVTIKAREESLGRAVTLDEERYTRQQVMDRNHALFVATQEGQLTPAQVESALAITRSIESSSNYTDMTNIGNGWSTLKAVYPMEHTGASDIAMINAFQRIIDPGATVREGDTVLLQSGAAFKDRYSVEFAQVKLGKGAKLPPELRENLYQLGRTIYAGRLENYEHTEGRRVSALAKASGLPLELLIGGGFPPAPSQNAIRDIE